MSISRQLRGEGLATARRRTRLDARNAPIAASTARATRMD